MRAHVPGVSADHKVKGLVTLPHRLEVLGPAFLPQKLKVQKLHFHPELELRKIFYLSFLVYN